MTGRLRHLVMGGFFSLAVVLAAAWLSAWPKWQSMPADTALIRLSFTHSGVRNCRDNTPEELAALPKNMRQARKCERRRAPVQVALMLDGETIYADELWPSGIAGSGPSRIYKRFTVPTGEHSISVKLRDDPGVAPRYTHEAQTRVTFAPARSFVIDFQAESGGFVFR